MNKIRQTKQRYNIITLIFESVLILAIFSGTINKMIYLAMGMVLMLGGLIAFLQTRWLTKSSSRIYFSILIWLIYQGFLLLMTGVSGIALYVFFQHAAIMMFFWSIVTYKQYGIRIKLIGEHFKWIHLLLIALMGVIIITHYRSRNPDAIIYMGLITLSFVLVDSQKPKKFIACLLCLLWCVFAYKANARAQIITFILFLVIYVVIGAVKNKRWMRALFVPFYLILNLWPMLYSFLAYSPYRRQLDNWAIQLTGSRFFSGRDVLWYGIYSRFINGRGYLFGLGLHETARLVRSNISLHNLFVTLIAEGGVIMVILFGWILQSVWNCYCNSHSNNATVGMTFLIAFLFKQSFDISLIENNLWVAFGVWFVLGYTLDGDEL